MQVLDGILHYYKYLHSDTLAEQVVCTCNPSTEARWLCVQGQPELHTENLKGKKKNRRKGNQILISFTHHSHGVCLSRFHILLLELPPALDMLSFEAACIGDFTVSRGGGLHP